MNIINSSIGEHDVYTDGSFQNIFTKDIKSGAACYWKQLELTTSIASTARSSTQAELHAIILCLQNASYEIQLRIHTDSQAAIQSISKSNASTRRKIRNQFSEEIQEIEQLIQNKRLKVEYIKVKGHAEIIENEKADQEAKKTACNSSNHIHFFNNSAKLATSTNEIITSDSKRYFQKWFTNRAILEWQANDLHLNLQDQLTKKGTNWKLSLQSFHPDGKITSGTTSFQTTSHQTYLIKLLTGKLPTATRKRLYNPQYSSTECLACNSTETNKHLFECNNSKEVMSNIFFELLHQISSSLNM